jgi:hypothetical protein
MQDQPISAGAEVACERIERLVLALLLGVEYRGPWSIPEVAREVGCEMLADAAVESLHAAGLAHRHAGFVWPTRAAARASALVGGVDVAGAGV